MASITSTTKRLPCKSVIKSLINSSSTITSNSCTASIKKIANKLDIEEDTVRNYFGGTHYKEGEGKSAGIHIERGRNGWYVHIDDDRILEIARSMIAE